MRYPYLGSGIGATTDKENEAERQVVTVIDVTLCRSRVLLTSLGVAVCIFHYGMQLTSALCDGPATARGWGWGRIPVSHCSHATHPGWGTVSLTGGSPPTPEGKGNDIAIARVARGFSAAVPARFAYGVHPR